MKVAAYTIALNEEQFVESWYESAKDADYLLIADTGSTDKTVELARSLGINVFNITVKPWRFDDARNASLALLPQDIDYCIALDMDEVLLPGWRGELEKALSEGWSRPRYKYTWSWNNDGSPGLQYGGDKIHGRNHYRWKHPVHEVIKATQLQETQGWIDLEIHHHPDNSKPRSQYLPLLKLSVDEDPTDDRNAYYYARELFYYGYLTDAKREFKRHLSLPTATWKAERANSLRYLAKCDQDNAKKWLLKSITESPERREPKIDLAQYYHDKGLWKECLDMALSALAIVEKPLQYLNESFSWGYAPYDFVAISSYKLGDMKRAVEYGQLAIDNNNDENELERLTNNLGYYKKAYSTIMV
jgi:glycosyltransferase involved in cell wall biosynthesis